jgi:glycosyltransferase involved in cell wall biosynthesis
MVVNRMLPTLAYHQFSPSIPKKACVDGISRVLYLVETLNVGGTETQLVQVALRLHAMSVPVTVGCLCAEGPLLEVLQQAGIPVVEFRKGKTLLSINGLYQVVRLAIFLRRGQFRVLHAYDLLANLLGVPAAWLARTSIIISSRRYLADVEWYRPWRNKVICTMYRLSTHVVVNSTSVRDLLVQRDGLPEEKIRILYNGVDVDRFGTARRDRQALLPAVESRTKLIAVVANMYVPGKGHAYLIAAAAQICREFPEIIFLLIGDGPERSKLEQQVRKAGLQKNFLFVGRRKDVPELLACCDLSVLPSEAEALPNSVLEAMAAGLPVVATRVGGIPEIIQDGENGLLVPPQNSQALAEAVIRLLEDSDLAQRLATAGQKRMRTQFSFDRLLGVLEQLYGAAPTAHSRPWKARLLEDWRFTRLFRRPSISRGTE